MLSALVILIVGLVCYRLVRLLKVTNLHEKHVFITGCDSGFGRSLALKLDELGVNVFAACLQDRSVDELTKQCSSRLIAIKLDVTKSSEVQKAVQFVKKTLGSKSLWGLVNNAGVSVPNAPFEWLTKEDYQRMVDINLLGTIDTTLQFYPLLRKGGQGRIVNIASQYGRFAPSASPYVVTKFGVEGFSDGLSKEARQFNISVHTIEPGYFKTNILDKQEEFINSKWKTLDKTIQKDYGDEFRQKSVNLMKKFDENSSKNVHWVVDALAHALTARYPQDRYVVGYDAKFVFIPISYLPCTIQNSLLQVLGKFTGMEIPTAACVKN